MAATPAYAWAAGMFLAATALAQDTKTDPRVPTNPPTPALPPRRKPFSHRKITATPVR